MGFVDLEALPVSPDPSDSVGQVRVWATAQLMELIKALSPYVNGQFGEVLPQHAQAYVAAVKEINRIWRVASPPRDGGDEQAADPGVVAAQMRDRVLAQLEALAARQEPQEGS